jgi:hypothetical protein
MLDYFISLNPNYEDVSWLIGRFKLAKNNDSIKNSWRKQNEVRQNS